MEKVPEPAMEDVEAQIMNINIQSPSLKAEEGEGSPRAPAEAPEEASESSESEKEVFLGKRDPGFRGILLKQEEALGGRMGLAGQDDNMLKRIICNFEAI